MQEKEGRMEFFLNSCSIDEIKEIYDWGILDGVTMNPSMLAAQGGDYLATFGTICRTVPVKIFAQVLSRSTSDIVNEARMLRSLGENVVVKIHTNIEGVRAITRLKSSTDIPVCATAIHSVIEGLAAAKAGADHVALFLGLLGEADERPVTALVRATVEALSAAGLPTRIMVAGRSLQQIVDGFRVGAHEMTCAYKLWKLFFANSFTRDRWKAFESDWHAAFGDKTWLSR